MGEYETLPGHILRPGSNFQNLNRARSFRDNCWLVAAKIMKKLPGRTPELSVTGN